MKTVHTSKNLLAGAALLALFGVAPLHAGWATYGAQRYNESSMRPEKQEPRLSRGLYTYIGLAIALDVNIRPICMQQVATPNVIVIDRFPTRIVWGDPTTGMVLGTGPFAGNITLNGETYAKYQTAWNMFIVVDDDGDMVEYMRLPNGLLMAFPLFKGDARAMVQQSLPAFQPPHVASGAFRDGVV